jgi:hypothetical protein
MPSVLAALVSRREQLLNRDPAVSLPKSLDARYRFIDLFLPAIHLGHDPGNGPAMAGDNQSFATLHVIQQLGQVGFGFGSLDLAHKADSSKRQTYPLHECQSGLMPIRSKAV